ncbi:ankyrin repeat-containing domain protein [Xylariaceae sp. FL1651]|nr:ankyrin repeat-containing domain protein [Xylariaceae sp. FL1651]
MSATLVKLNITRRSPTVPAVSDAFNQCEHAPIPVVTNGRGLPALPVELLRQIFSELQTQADRSHLAQTCRRVSLLLIPELYTHDAKYDDHHALLWACESNKDKLLEDLIRRDATIVDRIFTEDHSYHGRRITSKYLTPLITAIRASSTMCVFILLKNGANANLPDQEPVEGHRARWYPINWAVGCRTSRSIPIIKMLKKRGADINQIPRWPERIPGYIYPDIFSSASPGLDLPPIFRVLLFEKPRLPQSRYNELTDATSFNKDFKKLLALRNKQLKHLLENGADANAKRNIGGVEFKQTPVFFLLLQLQWFSTSFYFPDVLKLRHEENTQAQIVNEMSVLFLNTLKDYGADIHMRVAHMPKPPLRETTPLLEACALPDPHRPIIHWFLDNGVSINTPNAGGRTPLMSYCDARYGSAIRDLEQLEAFVKRGPCLNARDSDGRTALHKLLLNRDLRPLVREKAAKMLVKRGADPTIANNWGELPGQESKVYHPDFEIDDDLKQWLDEEVSKRQRKREHTKASQTRGKQNRDNQGKKTETMTSRFCN